MTNKKKSGKQKNLMFKMLYGLKAKRKTKSGKNISKTFASFHTNVHKYELNERENDY